MGLSPSGGLFIPQNIPSIKKKLEKWIDYSYEEIAIEVFKLFGSEEDFPGGIESLINDSFQLFQHEQIAPLVELDDNVYILELFHGPTLSFKDYPLQILGNLYKRYSEESGIPTRVLGATSGDTGSAAIYSVLNSRHIQAFILYPKNKISFLQEIQMTTTGSSNIYPIAIEGTFDDCQRIVKEIFRDHEFKTRHHLSAVNSINWARIVGQLVYYIYGWMQLPEKIRRGLIEFVVPSGNFGNALTGWYAMKMGLPIHMIRAATNRNDILHRVFTRHIYSPETVIPSYAPSMDIQVASNFERYLYYILKEDSASLNSVIKRIQDEGYYQFDHFTSDHIRTSHASDKSIIDQIYRVYENYDYIIDPHTACGFENIDEEKVTVVLGTAHPAKFPEVIQKSIQKEIKHPILEALKSKPMTHYSLAADIQEIKQFIKNCF